MRVSKADGSQVLDLQHDALIAAGVVERNIYSDTASGKKDERPGLDACLKAVRTGDTLLVWKLDRLGRNLRHLVNVVHDLNARGIGLRVLTGQGAAIDTTTAAGKLVFGIFAALAEFERELIRERTIAGLAAARARGGNGGRKPKMTPAKLRQAQHALGKKGTVVADLCNELGISSQTLYRHVSPIGELRSSGKKSFGKNNVRYWVNFGRELLTASLSGCDPLPPSAIQSSCVAVFLFDQLVRAQQDRCRHIEAKRLGGLHIEHGLVFSRTLRAARRRFP
jgi:DNA invertase Pin-like site-specific DNA recombinase